uniref:NB-ARC domain-containing protein n=1 Tax=Arundo donax TaxID=35708 RepID=A0A0A9AW87_ARUDO
MAEIALSLVMRLVQEISARLLLDISVLAEREASLLRSVPGNIRYIKDELETIGAFLGVVEDLQEGYPKYQMVKPWAAQVKDLVYDIEDCLEEHTIARTRNPSWSLRILNNNALCHFAAKLSHVRCRIVDVSERNRRYDLVAPYESKSSYMTITVVLDHVRSRFLKDTTQNDNSGDPKKEVGSLASASPEETRKGAPKVAAISGMCGSGKTSLAREIYNEKYHHFAYHAWIDLSQDVNVIKVFRDMIVQLFCVSSSQTGYIGEEEELAHHIQNKLRDKLFLIVFCGLWSLRAWNRIKRALPDISISGSLIIVTTEILHVAEDCTESADQVYCIPLLPEWKSLELLKDSVLKSENGEMSPEDKEDFQDLDLDSLKVHEPPFNTIAKVLMKCGGLKLAIKTISELLASEPPHKWGELCQDLPSLLYNDPRLNTIKRVMIRSYKGVPPYLKPCFLYLSIFPEGSDINVANVLRRWVAEGLVREMTGMSAEAVAVRYLTELFDRNLIKATKLTRNRSCKTCWIHPMMRDILVMIAQEEKFSITVGEKITSILPAKKFRHLTLDGRSGRKLVKSVDISGIRSLTVFNEPSESIASLICSSQMKTLRVLDFSNARFQITQRDIQHIGELCHLRYLNLYESSICELPSSIGMLPFLQLLNVRKTHITSLPSEITRLERLQILSASRKIEKSCHCRNKHCSYNSEGITVPKGIENLENLEGLEVVDVKGSSHSTIKDLGKLTQLKYLGLTGLTKKYSEEVSGTLQKLSPSLIYLYLGACRKNGTLCCVPTDKASVQFPHLRTIKLDGHIGTMPEWISQSLTLSVVKLYRTNMQQNHIKLMERMQSLITLALLEGSYVSEKLVFYAGTFTGLKRLELVGLPNLQVVKFKEKSAHQIREITIKSCKLSLFGRNNLKRLWDVHIDSGVKLED